MFDEPKFDQEKLVSPYWIERVGTTQGPPSEFDANSSRSTSMQLILQNPSQQIELESSFGN